jgi:FkbM family methyltransferase
MVTQLLARFMIRILTSRDYSILRGGKPFGIDYIYDLQAIFRKHPFTLIVDVGANRGDTVRVFSQRFQTARIDAYEPFESTFAELSSNCKSLTNTRCFKAALGREAGELSVPVSRQSELNSLVVGLQSSEDSVGMETIEVQTLDDIYANVEIIDILKIDTEGFEMQVLSGATTLLSQARILAIFAEVTFIDSDRRHTPFSTILEFLAKYGYYCVGVYDQSRFGSMGSEGYANALFTNPSKIAPNLTSNFNGLTPRLIAPSTFES